MDFPENLRRMIQRVIEHLAAQHPDFAARKTPLIVAAHIARGLIVDEARRRSGTDADAAAILKLDRALAALAEESPRLAQIVELRLFAAASEEQSAAALRIAPRTVRRDWVMARVRLHAALSDK